MNESNKMTNLEFEELKNIDRNQPVCSGKVLSKESAQALINMGLSMHYEGEYVLTEAGKQKYSNILSAEKLRDSGILYTKTK